MSDFDTTFQQIRELLKEFQQQRDWEQFHDPKNLAEAISIEASELMEHFLWKDKEKVIKELKGNKELREEVGDELADIFAFAINFANTANFDISSIIKNKLEKAKKKYPIDKAKGRAIKYNKL